MILISHRGNINGKIIERENEPSYIDEAIQLGYDVEIDLWYQDSFLLGHDFGFYKIEEEFLLDRSNNLWIHCKNRESFGKMIEYKNLNFFWHDKDNFTITSKGYVIGSPKNLVKGCISMVPEIYNDDTSNCLGICSDYIVEYGKQISIKHL